MLDPHQPYNEEELIIRFKKGDVDAFTQLYHRYNEQIYCNVLRMVKDENTAEEIVQDLFVKVWQKRFLLQTDTYFAAFLYRVGKNMVYDFFRKVQRDRILYANFQVRASECYSHIEEELNLHESERHLHKVMDTLTPQQQKVYQLCKLDGITYKKAADLMGISIYTVKEYLSKANQRVCSYMIEHQEMILLPLLFLNPGN